MAINDIKIKSHNIYIEKDSNKNGGNLTIGTSKNKSDLTVNGNMNVSSGTLYINSALHLKSDIFVNSSTIYHNNNLLKVIANGISLHNTSSTNAVTINSRTIKISSLPFSTNNEIATNSLTVNTSGISVNSSVNDNDSNILKTSSLNMSSTGISLTTSGSTNVINISSPTMNLITDSMYIKSSTNSNNYIAVDYNTSTSRFTLSSMELSLNTEYELSLNTHNNGSRIEIDSPAISVKTDRIDLESKTKDSFIDIDGFIKYTPTTNRSDFVSCDLTAFIKNNKFNLSQNGATYRLKIVETLSSEEKAFFEPSKLYDIKFQFSLKDKEENKSEKNIIYLQQKNIFISGDSLFLQMEANSSLYNHFLSLNNKLNEQYVSTTGYSYRYEITYPIFQAKHKGNDATVSIDEHARIQINDSNHLLLTSSSTGTTNISHFPDAVYSTDKNRLIVQAVSNVTLYPGDFIEYYPITEYPCYLYSSTLMGDPKSAILTNGKAGYIYFNANGNVFIQDCDNRYSTTTNSSSIQILFLVSNGWGASSPVIIKK